jgi:thiamine pyrophosphate-dependent acetolactate synthase large subunit-like protein
MITTAARRVVVTSMNHRFTIGVEEDIIAALEELIAALQQAQRDQEEKQQQQQQQQQQDDEQPLVDQIAELKMIKSLQERVNKRTQRYARLLADESDPIGQAEAPDLAAAVRQLSARQQEIFKITRDIVLGKNK